MIHYANIKRDESFGDGAKLEQSTQASEAASMLNPLSSMSLESFSSPCLLWPADELYAQLSLPQGDVPTAKGPHSRSNWLPLGWPRSRFCAGGWPFQLPSGYGISGPEADDTADAKARSLLEAGVTTFVNLCQEGEIPESGSYPTWMPRLQEMEIALQGEEVKTQLRFDIMCTSMPDGWVTTDTELTVLLERLLSEVDNERRTLYVHCYGGHGRTGVVACSLLCLLYPVKVLQEVPDEIKDTWARVNINRHSPAQIYSKEAWAVAEGAVAVFNRFHAERENEEGGGYCRFPHSAAQFEQVVRVAQGAGAFGKLPSPQQ